MTVLNKLGRIKMGVNGGIKKNIKKLVRRATRRQANLKENW